AVLAAIWLAAGPRHAMSRANFGAFAGAVLVVGAAGLMYATAGRELRADYETVWSPQSVRKIAGYLERHAAPGDEVLSGAVMWELQADRPPFDRISHPLAFMFGMQPDSAAALEQTLEARPPAFVVLDGYTEQTFGAVLPDFQQVLSERYALVDSATGANFPVRLYELRERMARE
ncbi:MAG TPA: hypothetical protein VFW66_10055, partial [Gemmatimonadales bacterium]|nr:hypothetical protein [Gemmatimonadales bacterium]